MQLLIYRLLRLAGTAAALAILLVAAGCGTNTEPPASKPSATGSVSIEHGMGTTILDGTPQRIVALSASWADSLLALDITPVGIGTLTGIGPDDGKFPWQGQFDAKVVPLSLIGAPGYEEIAALAPDLILADYSANTPDVYAKLSGIAPTIALPDRTQFVAPWRDQTRVVGRILGREADAEILVAKAEAAITAVRDHLPEDRKTIAIGTAEQHSIGVIASPADPTAVLFRELGLELSPAVVALGNGKSRLTVSPERAAEALSADILLIRPKFDPAELPSRVLGWPVLPAVASDSVVVVDAGLSGALSDPSVLNIGYLLDAVRPTLERSGQA